MEKGLMNLTTLAEYLDIKKAQLFNLTKREDFPKPVALNTKAVQQAHRYWLKTSIDKWLNDLQRQADEQGALNDCGNN